MNKKAEVSPLVATALIIMITVGAVAIIWATVIPMITGEYPCSEKKITLIECDNGLSWSPVNYYANTFYLGNATCKKTEYNVSCPEKDEPLNCPEDLQTGLGCDIEEANSKEDYLVETTSFPREYFVVCEDGFEFNITFDVENKAEGLTIPFYPSIENYVCDFYKKPKTDLGDVEIYQDLETNQTYCRPYGDYDAELEECEL